MGSYTLKSALATSLAKNATPPIPNGKQNTYLIRMTLANTPHIHDLDLTRQNQLPHPDLFPPAAFPEHRVQARQQSAEVIFFTAPPAEDAVGDGVGQGEFLVVETLEGGVGEAKAGNGFAVGGVRMGSGARELVERGDLRLRFRFRRGLLWSCWFRSGCGWSMNGFFTAVAAGDTGRSAHTRLHTRLPDVPGLTPPFQLLEGFSLAGHGFAPVITDGLGTLIS